MKPRTDSAIAFEVVARRIRARAERMLAELPIEDPDVVWARRMSLVAEADRVGRGRWETVRTRDGHGIWRWGPPPGGVR